MKRLRIFVATMVFFAASPLGIGQRCFAVSRSAERSEKTPPAKTSACAEIAAWMNVVLRAGISAGADSPSVPKEIAHGNLQPRNLDCGGVPSLVSSTPLELVKVFYDRTLHSWEFLVRCAHTTDCVPFLVRWPQPAGRNSAQPDQFALSQVPPAPRINLRATQHFLLRPGETVTLVWDQDGIRVVLPAICLDGGNVGESIRVRTTTGGRVLRAEIVNESLLRVIL
ncbi:MAG TPA: flagella basal body P-ring formation protein FlgA [Candidatus Sulfotelmatobacter sp.]